MRTLVLLVRVLAGLLRFALTGRNGPGAYGAMRRLYARTDGRFNDAILALYRRLRPWRPQPVDGCLGRWSVAEQQAVADALRRDGIAVFERRLPEAMCAALERHARTVPCLPMGASEPQVYGGPRQALRHDFSPQDIVASPEACRVLFDGTFAALAGAYFGARPVFDFAAMWWTTAAGERDLSAAAQKFHYDMDRLYFLKFFVYLTDVTPQTGPHVFVAGSHRRKPQALRRDGRFEDADIARHYPAEAIRSICAPRGTVFAADTRGLHKGQPVLAGERLVLQVEFALNRFGQSYVPVRVSAADLRARGLAAAPDARVFPDVAQAR